MNEPILINLDNISENIKKLIFSNKSFYKINIIIDNLYTKSNNISYIQLNIIKMELILLLFTLGYIF